MRRVLLVIDDYSELTFLQTLLRKVGFDVETIQKESKVGDALISFNPDIVVATGHGKQVSGLRFTQKIKRRDGHPKIVLIFPGSHMSGVSQMKKAVVDIALESPIKPRRLIEVIGRLSDLDVDALLSKYERVREAAKLTRQGGENELIQIKHTPKTKYAEATKDLEAPPQQKLNKDSVVMHLKGMQEIRENPEFQDLDAEKKDFVKALFKKSN